MRTSHTIHPENGFQAGIMPFFHPEEKNLSKTH